jgi:hypothetical protein
VTADEPRDICDGQHTRIQCSQVIGAEAPVPAWPPPEAATHCMCGAALAYHHSVDVCVDSVRTTVGPHDGYSDADDIR